MKQIKGGSLYGALTTFCTVHRVNIPYMFCVGPWHTFAGSTSLQRAMGRTHQDIVEEEGKKKKNKNNNNIIITKRKIKGRRKHTWVNHPKLFGRCTCTSSYVQFMFHAGEGWRRWAFCLHRWCFDPPTIGCPLGLVHNLRGWNWTQNSSCPVLNHPILDVNVYIETIHEIVL